MLKWEILFRIKRSYHLFYCNPFRHRNSSSSGIALISFVFSPTRICPKTRDAPQAHALTSWDGRFPLLSSFLRRMVFPSMATTPSIFPAATFVQQKRHHETGPDRSFGTPGWWYHGKGFRRAAPKMSPAILSGNMPSPQSRSKYPFRRGLR